MPGRLRALWLCTGALALGAWAGSHPLGPVPPLAAGVVAGLLLGIAGYLRRHRPLVVIALCSGVLALGYVGSALRSEEGLALERAAARTRSCGVVVRVLEQAGGLGTLVSLEAATCTTGAVPSGNLMWDTEDPPPIGTVVSGEGWITRLGDDGFAHARRSAGARGLLLLQTEERSPPAGVAGWVVGVRRSFRDAARSELDARRAALLLGLTIGDTDGFSPRDLDDFRVAGLSHVLAVSGSNVALVLGGIGALTRGFGATRRMLLMFAGVLVFVALVGPDGSVLRAGVMGVVALLAGGWTRPVDPRYSLPFALIVLIGVRPTLVTAAGLHLSAAATLGIVLWSRSFSRSLGFLPAPVAAVLGVTLAAQLAVAPILVVLFQRLSLVAPVSNLLVAPAIALATILGLIACACSAWVPPISALAVRLAGLPLRWVLEVAERSAAPAWAEIRVSSVWAWVLGPLLATAVFLTLRRGSAA